MFERVPQHHRTNFGSRVFGDVLNVLRELNLQSTRQVETVFGLHDVRNATLARLAVHANNRFVCSANMLWVKRQVGNTPLVVVVGKSFKALLDGVLMAARKCRVHQVTNIWLALWNRKAIAILGIAAQSIDVGDVEFWVYAIYKQVHSQRNEVDVACALAVAEQRSFNAICSCHHAKFGSCNCTSAVVVRVQ